MANYTRISAGAAAKRNGARFEEEIIHICNNIHELTGLLYVQKTPEPVKHLSKMNPNGTFTAVYTSVAQPDFKGVIAGGRCLVFEAKYSAEDTIQHKRVTPEQIYMLREYADTGAAAYVVVRLKNETYVIPARTWERLPLILKRKSYHAKHLKHFKIKDLNQLKNGLTKLTRGVVYYGK